MSYRTSSNLGDPAGVNPWPSLDDEIAARIAGDAALLALSQAETTARQLADAGLQALIDTITDQITDIIATDEDLQDQITALGEAIPGALVSSDGSFGFPAPTGVGFEWRFFADELDGPYMDGVAL